ncbi:MAG: site-2 protease family protein [bacterium]
MPSQPAPDYRYVDDLYRQFGQEPPPKRQFLARILRDDKPKLNYILFVATFFATFITWYFTSGSISGAFWYSGGIMSILLAHEMGHYVMCRKYNVRATLPFFLPLPLISPFGTLGAVIKMEGRMPNRRVLFDIGAGGPIAGLLLTLPAFYFGIKMSNIVALDTLPKGTMYFGESLLYKSLSVLAIGKLPEGYDVMLHPLAFAGWVGLFVTALNLLPIGQLDGGHVIYALFGERSRYIYPVVLSAFIVVAILFYIGWIPLILLLLFFRIEHPPTLDPSTGLDVARKYLAVVIFIIFALSFTIIPFQIEF